jgi:hypothetical protein
MIKNIFLVILFPLYVYHLIKFYRYCQVFSFLKWWTLSDLNRGPTRYERGALTN